MEDLSKFGTAVIDGMTLGWILDLLLVQPEPLLFFDIAAFVEAVVLHDEIRVLLPAKCDLENERVFENALRETLAPLTRAGIVKFETMVETRPSASPDTYIIDKNVTALDASEDFAAWMMHQSARFVIGERAVSSDAVVLPSQSAMYKMNRRVRVEHSVCKLYQNYESVRDLALLCRARSSSTPPANYDSLAIPPISLDVFANSNSTQELWQRTGDLWEKWSDLRSRHRDLRMLLDDKTLSLKEKQRHSKQWRDAWDHLSKKWRERVNSFVTADTTTELQRSNGMLSTLEGIELGNDGSFAFDAGNPHKWLNIIWKLVERARGYWKLRELHDSLESYWKINDRELYSHVERLIGITVTASEHEKIVETERQERAYISDVVICDLYPD